MKFFSKRGRTQLTVESLSVDLVPDKLARAEIPVFCVQKIGKNELSFEVASSMLEKTFAILRGSCYNIKKTRSRGLTLLYERCLSAFGFLIGAMLFTALVLFAETRVLRIEVVGSGAYYDREVREILLKNGVERFSPLPRDTAQASAEILSLPLVTGCFIRSGGGILTVEVRTGGEKSVLPCEPLLSPCAGRVEELTVLRGTACVTVGEDVERGQKLVDCVAIYGEECKQVVVIARVKISFPVSAEYAGNEMQARAGAYLDYGEIEDFRLEKTEKGYLVTGRAFIQASLNLT